MTARYADRVALMSSNGRIAEAGDPRQLVEDQGSRLSSLINKVNGLTQACLLDFGVGSDLSAGVPVVASRLRCRGGCSGIYVFAPLFTAEGLFLTFLLRL